MDETITRIRALLQGPQFGISETVAEATALRDLPKWDSLKTLMFLMEVEKEFDIEIASDEIVSLKTIGDVAAKAIKHS